MYEIGALVVVLKLVIVVVMLVGGVAVFRELIPMARGRQPTEQPVKQPTGEDA
ncbi:MAG: hypothetical protein H0X37_26975 [Herpetosiphonaceae bacterium]|nr:hypothetical protein [Herpetosiphonaceae bacterium]